MYGLHETYAVYAAFLQGYDEAYEGGLLAGFREWLVVRLKTGSNLAWSVLVLYSAFPGIRPAEDALPAGSDAERAAIDTLFALLAEFDDIRGQHDGLRKIYRDYEKYVSTLE